VRERERERERMHTFSRYFSDSLSNSVLGIISRILELKVVYLHEKSVEFQNWMDCDNGWIHSQ
jgi:hypothetical protein